MAKGTLTFDLDNPDDELKFKRAVIADEMASCLWEIKNNVWRKFKHVDEPVDHHEYWKAINEVMEHIDIDRLWQ